ncbi:hypothetical protein [Paraburkholderia sp. GAS334]|uniref:hypothetical protein n=1 Tax=Paraburkholderia sp. GAS334 TaxID=3035131 RepID=UPI003D21D943
MPAADNVNLLQRLPARDYRLRFLGFNGGAVGNHAQLIFAKGNTRILLDPTTSIIAKADYNELLGGTPIAPIHVMSFVAADSPDIVKFRETVANALLQGKYKPSDALYFFQNLDDFVAAAKRFHQYANGNRKIEAGPGAVPLANEWKKQ